MRPGRIALTAHALGGELLGEASGQRVDRAFRCGVVDIEAGRTEARGGRRHHHDRAARAPGGLRQSSRRLARGEAGAQHIDLENAAHALDAHVDEPRRRRDDAGVGDHARQRPERPRRSIEHGHDVGFDGDVAAQRDRAAAALDDRIDHRAGRLGVVAIIDADRPAVSGGEQGAGAADAARGSGDEKDFGGHDDLG